MIQALIGASLSAMLPLASGAGAMVPDIIQDDYPPDQPSYFDVEFGLARCYYRNHNYRNNYTAALEINVWSIEPRTMAIICPKKGTRTAFSISYSRQSVLYVGDYPNNRSSYFFEGSPPDQSGLDPLVNLDQSIFEEDWEGARLAASRVAWSVEHTTLFDSDLEIMTDDERAVMFRLSRVCWAVIEAVKKRFGSFSSLCDAYHEIVENAVSTAQDQEEPSEDDELGDAE
ncbi:hypothetical protein FOZ61_008575 [Perkinsus olseni]|uniref:Uncharacterized protein n=1 Tax=Perkinsus olseni TaxID=32597 RepID=A0A7J6LVV9_PEROL|nr:hypothetical protein FOZ61_008575 [Perkinsus olseni]KAF4663452.1 hypothetical protein FOL46_004736 [Perkinsus olseni]